MSNLFILCGSDNSRDESISQARCIPFKLRVRYLFYYGYFSLHLFYEFELSTWINRMKLKSSAQLSLIVIFSMVRDSMNIIELGTEIWWKTLCLSSFSSLIFIVNFLSYSTSAYVKSSIISSSSSSKTIIVSWFYSSISNSSSFKLQYSSLS